jgi:hypothetical protein
MEESHKELFKKDTVPTSRLIGWLVGWLVN